MLKNCVRFFLGQGGDEEGRCGGDVDVFSWYYRIDGFRIQLGAEGEGRGSISCDDSAVIHYDLERVDKNWRFNAVGGQK